MSKDEKRALLGDHEAAKRLTDAGVLVPGNAPTTSPGMRRGRTSWTR